MLLDTFPAIGEYAVSVGSRVLLEPLNRGEAFFLRQVADAASICRDINSPGVQMMGDFYHMCIEETSDMGAFLSAGSYVAPRPSCIAHPRLAGPGRAELRRRVPRPEADRIPGLLQFRVRRPGRPPNEEIPKSMAFLRDQWAQA